MAEKNNTHIVFSGAENAALFDELYGDTTIQKLDLFQQQKEELRKTLLFGKPKEEQDKYLSTVKSSWVYYPWDKLLINILSEKDFISVRTSRNLYKITSEEQSILSQKKVGVVGLSVGRMVSLTLALERTCGEIRIADFDTIELSNLNRLKSPLKEYGIAKTVSTKREINNIDPYLEVTTYDEGITSENLHSFFTKNGKLDLLIDECDSLDVKILLRKKAKELNIPVVMDTSDRGMLDVERYDLNKNQRYFNGLIGFFDPPYNFTLSPEERLEFLAQIIDFGNVSDRAKKSVAEIGNTISTWPQLASSVVMGGGAATEITRRILLGEHIESGRYFIDLEEIIPNAKRG